MSILAGTAVQILNAAKDWASKGIQEELGTKGYNKTEEMMTTYVADGSLTKILRTLIVEPTYIVTASARQSKIYDKVLALDLDIFVSFYVQVFYILTQVYCKSDLEAIDLLSTNKYTGKGMIETARRKLVDSGLELSREDNITPPTTLNQLDFASPLMFLNNQEIKELAVTFAMSLEAKESAAEILAEAERLKKLTAEEQAKTQAAKEQQEKDKKEREFLANKELINQLTKQNQNAEKDREDKAIDRAIAAADKAYARRREDVKRREEILGQLDKKNLEQLLVRTVDVTLSRETANKDTDLLKIPMTIIGGTRIVKFDELAAAIANYDYKKSFAYRWKEWRSGGISLANLIFAGDLVEEYRKNRLSKSSKLFADLEDAKNASVVRKAVTGKYGTETSYNMIVITQYEADMLSKLYKKDLNGYTGYNAFLEVMNGHNLTILDEDNERVNICIRDIKNTMDVGYNRLLKRDDKDNNYMDFFKNLISGSVPKF
jgi:hypothetical protein